ncbi:MAG TPA: hypothetical protein ENJ31_10455 [Anaerolineae bacterium]|nr:hypothetical protein [Anaerolineae bacterium]
MELFPALLIGGPPDSGKSVLTYHLTQALREQGVAHYVLRANPDGEGDWRAQVDPARIHTILFPRDWTPALVEHVCQDISRRQLPLIVDMGGRPQPWQEAILDHCTHAVLLTPDRDSHTYWSALFRRHNLLLVADLRSELHGADAVTTTRPVLRGIIAGLEWGQSLHSPSFDALVDRVAHLFAYDAEELRRTHLALAPVETTVDLDRLAHALGVPRTGQKTTWEPQHLPALLDYLPVGVPLGLYGRAPNWLYAAVALQTRPAAFYQFDPRLGWIAPPALCPASMPADALLRARVVRRTDHLYLDFSIPGAYLDYLDAEGLAIPAVPGGTGLVLGGKIPHWLYTGLVLAYSAAPWIAVYQPQLQAAVVCHSAAAQPIVGALIPC